jgi:hypothetical protein
VSELHARLLERAAEILGGENEVAAYLGVSLAHLRIWTRGMFAPPADIFLKLVDLISEEKRPLSSPGDDAPRSERARR